MAPSYKRDWQDLSFLQKGSTQQQKAWFSLQETKILQLLAEFEAMLAGTLPLDIDIPGSDLDIICTTQDFERFSAIVTQYFSHYSSFKIQSIDVKGEATLLASFHDGHFSYEIFAQAVPVQKQNAYLHMIAEAFLLDLGGTCAQHAIRSLKMSGLKTEPAFASYFGIAGDSYIELREMALQILSNKMELLYPATVRKAPHVTNEEKYTHFVNELREFGRKMLDQIVDRDILPDIIAIDHACYRVPTVARYEEIKYDLLHSSTLLSEAMINGRPIATYKLPQPIDIGHGFHIDLLELPAPKPTASYEEGFEHVEAVTKESLEVFMKKHAHLTFNTGNLQAAINRDVSTMFPEGLIKFHEARLEQVIAQEQLALLRKPGPRPVVVVDFDDTLISSTEPFLRSVHMSIEKYLNQTIPPEVLLEKARPTFPEFFANLGIEGDKAIQSILKIFAEVWRGYAPHCHIPTGILSMLSCLKSEGFKILVWTARDRATTEEFILSSKLNSLIDDIFTFDDDGIGKPTPSSTLRKALGQSPGAMIGDSNSDALAAQNLGFPFLQASWVHQAKLEVDKDNICTSPFVALTRTMTLLHKI